MELLIFIIIGLVILFFLNVAKFNKKLMRIEDKNVIFVTGDEVNMYQDYLLAKIDNDFPSESSKEKVKVVIEAIRNAAKRNGKVNFLNGLKYGYREIFEDMMGRLKQIQNMSEQEKSNLIEEHHNRQMMVLKLYA